MALDFHLATNKKAPMGYVGSFKENIHQTIFDFLPQGRFNHFRKLEDYYSDAKYSKSEIGSLIQDIDSIAMHFTDQEVTNQLNEIKQICIEAMEKGMELYVYCD